MRLRSAFLAMKAHVIGLQQHTQILFTVVATLVVQVVNILGWLDQPAKNLFHDQAVLEYVASGVGVGMIGSVHVDVAAAMHEAAAFPRVATRALDHRRIRMTHQAWNRVAAKVPLGPFGVRGERSDPAASTLAEAGGDFLGCGSVADVPHAPVTLQELRQSVSVFRMGLDDAAATTGARSGPKFIEADHARILTHTPVTPGQSNLEA